MILLDGKTNAQKILNDLKSKIAKLSAPLQLDIILVGDNPASVQYVSMKQKKAQLIGVKTNLHQLPSNSPTKEIINLIRQLNVDNNVTGILVQLPLPSSLDTTLILNTIDSSKDADGLTAANLGLLFQKNPLAIPSATPFGIIKLLETYQIDLVGKNVVIIGRSPYIGLPLTALFLQKNSTVTVCHSYTQNLKTICQSADILVSAVGRPNFITSEHIKEGCIVIDVGLSPDPQTGKLVGDVNFETVAPRCSYLTPVPGGVGPMTIASLLENTVNISRNKEKAQNPLI